MVYSHKGYTPMNVLTFLIASEQAAEKMDFVSLGTIVIAMITTIITLVNNFANNKRLKGNFYSETVSESRIKWIETMRDSVVALAAFFKAHPTAAFDDLSAEEKKEIETLRNTLLVHVTPMSKIKEYNKAYSSKEERGEINAAPISFARENGGSVGTESSAHDDFSDKIAEAKSYLFYSSDALLNVYLSANYECIRENADVIRDIVTVICKEEWNRIKAEAGGDKNLEAKIEKYQKSVAKQRLDALKSKEKEEKKKKKR